MNKIKVTILKPFSYIFAGTTKYMREGQVVYFDLNNSAESQEASYVTSSSFPYRAFISVEFVNSQDPSSPCGGSGGGSTGGGNTGGSNGGGNGSGNTGGLDLGRWLGSSSSNPSNPGLMDFYYNTTTGQLLYWNGSSWLLVPNGTIGGGLGGGGSTGGGTGGNNQQLPPIQGDLLLLPNNELQIRPGVISDADINPNAKIKLSKLESNPLDRINHVGVQTSSSIVDFDSRVRSNSLSSFRPATSSLSMGGNRITNLDYPCEADDAVPRAYVDAKLNSIDLCSLIPASCDLSLNGYKITSLSDPSNNEDAVNLGYMKEYITKSLGLYSSVRLLADYSLNSPSGIGYVIDGKQVRVGDRVLLTCESDPRRNGVYIVSNGLWFRSEDTDANVELSPGRVFFVIDGNLHINSGYVTFSPDSPIVLGISPIYFNKFTGFSSSSIGQGLQLVNNRLEVKGAIGQTIVTPLGVEIDPSWTGSSSISVLGTITQGRWRGSPIEVAYGGTGAGTAAQARVNLRAAASGINSDITSIEGLSIPLSVDQGGTGGCTPEEARYNLQAADCINGVSTCITQLPNLVGPIAIHQGGTGATNRDTARFNLLAAKSGDNYDITSLNGLTTPLSIAQGGTGATTAIQALTNLGGVSNASNIGTGSAVFAQKNGTVLEFRNIRVNPGITIQIVGNDLVLSPNLIAGAGIQLNPVGTAIQIVNLNP